jgi:hypothetical protein
MAKNAPTTRATLARRRYVRSSDIPPSVPATDTSGPPDGFTARQGTIRPSPHHFFTGSIPANAYGAPLLGNCLEPELFDGDMALVSPIQEPQAGDFVVLYPVAGGMPKLKRLVMTPMFPVGTPLHPDSDVMPMVMVEMLNPPQQLMVTVDKLKAMHKVVGLIRKDEVDALRNLTLVSGVAGLKAGVA